MSADTIFAAISAIALHSRVDAATAQAAVDAAAADDRPRAPSAIARLAAFGRRDLAVRLYQEAISAADGNVLAAAMALRMSRSSAYRVARELGLDEWLEEHYPDRPGTAGAAARHGR